MPLAILPRRSQVMKTGSGGGGSAGPLTSISLAGTQTISDASETAVVFDTEEATTNLVAGVPTVPSDGDYEIDWSVFASSAGGAGGVRAKVVGSVTGDLDKDEQAPAGGLFIGTLSGSRRRALVAGETLTLTVLGSTGASVDLGSDVTATFLQFWAA